MIKITVNTVYPPCPAPRNIHPVTGNARSAAEFDTAQWSPTLLPLRASFAGKASKTLLLACESVQHSEEEQRHGVEHCWLQRLGDAGQAPAAGKEKQKPAPHAQRLGNPKLFTSYFYKATEQKRYPPDCPPLPPPTPPHLCRPREAPPVLCLCGTVLPFAPESSAQAAPPRPGDLLCASAHPHWGQAGSRISPCPGSEQSLRLTKGAASTSGGLGLRGLMTATDVTAATKS